MMKKQAITLLFAAALILTSCNIGATPAPTVDVNAINTAAFNTAMAQISTGQTQTAFAAPSATSLPTNTPLSLVTVPPAGNTTPGANAVLPTVSFNTSSNTNTTPGAGITPVVLGSPAVPVGKAPTAALGDECTNNAFEGDITIPDGSVLEAGTNFTKTWKIRNTGNCKWDDGFSLVYIGGSSPNLDPYNVNFSKNWDSKDFIDPGEAVNISVDLTSPCTPGKYEGHWRMRNDKGYYFGTILSVYIEVKEKRKNCGK